MCSQMADPNDTFPFDDADTASNPDPLPVLDSGTAPTIEVDDLRRAIRDAAVTCTGQPLLAQTAESGSALNEERLAADCDIAQGISTPTHQVLYDHLSNDTTLTAQQRPSSSFTSLSSALLSIPGVTTFANLLSSVGRFFSNLATSSSEKDRTVGSENRISYVHLLITECSSLFGRTGSLFNDAKPKNFFLNAIDTLYDSLKTLAKGQRAAQQLAEAALEAENEEKKKNRDRAERERREQSEARDKVRAIDALNGSSNGETPSISAKIGGAFFSVEEAIRMARDAERREELEEDGKLT